ncbi:hypothetical protein F4821DRAFT_278800 [Hypoxylon rubiginosum]|uniref:Uncharacterized protein n=1 Tax=Hypoxylon rubiginosum TaxID=110542 RepID=A0ACC0DIC6_9PEZI|nr:hypothetical protein F4821DRAFT_278800 [Hypoxylon rubiginosum]
MGANQSAEQERELGKDCERNEREMSAQYLAHSVDTGEDVGAARRGNIDTDNEGDHDMEQNNGQNNGLHGFEGTYSVKGGWGPEDSCSLQSSHLRTGGQETDSTCPGLRRGAHQAASERVEPQSRGPSLGGSPSRTQSPRATSCNSPWQNFNFDPANCNNSLEAISPKFGISNYENICLSRLQARFYKQNNDYSDILKITQDTPINFENMAPITRSKRATRTPLPGARTINVLTRSAGVAKPTKATKKEVKKEAKKETKEEKPAREFDPRFLASDGDNTSSENERAMTDRLGTMSRATSFESLNQAIDEYLDDAMKAILKAKASQLFTDKMVERIKDDKNTAGMKTYMRESHQGPKFTFSECKNPHNTIQHTPANRHRSLSHRLETRTMDRTEEPYKFVYTIMSTPNVEILSADQIINHAVRLPQYFATREKANARLDQITQYDKFEGGMAAVSRRLVYEDTPLRLLKVELTLNTGEERVLWVERCLVNLDRDLTKNQRALKKWSATRPKLPHYIVECEFMTRKTTETPLQLQYLSLEEDEESEEGEEGEAIVTEPSSKASQNLTAATAATGYSGDIELNRLPLVTFTDRTLANEHAGDLFLEHSAVSREIRGPLDDFWWANNAVPLHRDAEAAAREEDALYVAELDTRGMVARLGFDWIRVAVYKVDDVRGPLNI